MDQEKTFQAVNDDVLIGIIRRVRERLVFIAPGVRRRVAEAIVDAVGRLLDHGTVNVILDVSAEVCRLGYGDIDGLKKINDSYGHSAGDNVIRTEAEILKKTFRQSDIIGRLGGDEFAVVAPHLSEKKLQLALHLIEDFSRQWNESSGEQYRLSLSVGAAVYNAGEIPNLEGLLKKADDELYLEKQKKTRRL